MTKQLGINDLEIILRPSPNTPPNPPLIYIRGEPLILKGELMKQSLWGQLRDSYLIQVSQVDFFAQEQSCSLVVEDHNKASGLELSET